jgi:hypothetical protein
MSRECVHVTKKILNSTHTESLYKWSVKNVGMVCTHNKS